MVEQLIVLRDKAIECTACELHKTRTNVVFGIGQITRPNIAFVGEAPGQAEDEQAEPFVGASGKLLTQYIESVGLSRDRVYITNSCMCRPPGNRKPRPEELASCKHFLEQQLSFTQPQVIVTLGTTATQNLLNVKTPISQLRGKWHDWHGIQVRATFHPSYLLRDPRQKPLFEEDMKAVVESLLFFKGSFEGGEW